MSVAAPSPSIVTGLVLGSLLCLWPVAPALAAPGPHADHTGHADHAGHQPPQPASTETAFELDVAGLPDVTLVDQDGRPQRLRELLQGRAVAMNFIFTTCTTICPPMGAVLSQMRRELGRQGKTGVTYLSLSIDPVVDTPARLKAWSQRFETPSDRASDGASDGAQDPWRLLTGTKSDVDAVLKALGLFTALKEDHSPILLLGNGAENRWTRAYGLSAPDGLAARLQALASPEPAEDDGARAYFTDTPLLDQNGRSRRFYSDLIDGKIVVITSFFADCNDSCPLIHGTMAKIQRLVGDRLGRDVNLISITVDPDNDTPSKLAEYAAAYHAEPGWYFLTGAKKDVNRVLAKLGHQVDERTAHKSIFLVGNQKTGLWKKAFALGPPQEVLAVVESVLQDRPPADAAP